MFWMQLKTIKKGIALLVCKLWEKKMEFGAGSYIWALNLFNYYFIFFSASAGAFCGNKIVEAGEECDCGYDDDECIDKCCYPRLLGEKDKLMNESARGCARRKGTECRCVIRIVKSMGTKCQGIIAIWTVCQLDNLVSTQNANLAKIRSGLFA